MGGIPTTHSLAVDGAGNLSGAISIPPVAIGGWYAIVITGSASGSQLFTNAFYIQPAIISVNLSQGYPGTNITIYGYGWNPAETVRVYYDNALQQVLAPSGSTWTAIITASGAMGYHTITARGTSSGTQTASFRIIGPPRYITQSTTQGPPGTPLTISGYNFNIGESVYVTFGGLLVVQGVADYIGYFSLPFTIPEKPVGSYSIDAYGNLTSAASIANLSFSVVPIVSASPTSAEAREQITIIGKGFRPSSVINLSYNGTTFFTTSNTLGSFTVTNTAPNKTGSYTVTASDASGYNASATFSVISPISALISTTTPIVGEELTISGSSQVPGTITIAYDGVTIGTTATSPDGSFTFSFRTPKSVAGHHTIIVTDSLGNSAATTLTIESTPPPVPAPVEPKYGSRAGWSRTVTFSWREVSDPSGVVYNLRVRDSASEEVLSVSGITTLNYKANLPSEGAFSWSVQAEDGAGNTSAWAGPVSFVAGPPMPIWAMVILGMLVVCLAGLLYYFVKIRHYFIKTSQPSPPRKKGKAEGAKAKEIKVVVKTRVSGPVKTKELAKKITKEVTKQLAKKTA
jgi:hypothetical protein